MLAWLAVWFKGAPAVPVSRSVACLPSDRRRGRRCGLVSTVGLGAGPLAALSPSSGALPSPVAVLLFSLPAGSLSDMVTGAPAGAVPARRAEVETINYEHTSTAHARVQLVCVHGLRPSVAESKRRHVHLQSRRIEEPVVATTAVPTLLAHDTHGIWRMRSPSPPEGRAGPQQRDESTGRGLTCRVLTLNSWH